MNDIQIGDVFAHRTLTIKTPFTPVPFPATYVVQAIYEKEGKVRLRPTHHYRLNEDGDKATLITELPDPDGAWFLTTPDVIEESYVFLRHADGGI